MEEKQIGISFQLRVIHNQIKAVIGKSISKNDLAPQSQLQGGILGYLYHHREDPVYQGEIEKVFRISRATATNTLQVMEKNGLILRKKQDKDGRLKRIFMTEEAAANHARLEEGMKTLDEYMQRGMTEAEKAELGRYLKLIMTNLEDLYAEYCLAEEAKPAGPSEETGQRAPEETGQEVPTETGQEVPAETGQEAPEQKMDEAWQPTGQEAAGQTSTEEKGAGGPL